MDIYGETAGDLSGRTVDLSNDGSVLAIGARDNGGNGKAAGHVRVFKWNGAGWERLGNDIDGEMAEDYSGESVGLSKDGLTVAIGAVGNEGKKNTVQQAGGYNRLSPTILSA